MRWAMTFAVWLAASFAVAGESPQAAKPAASKVEVRELTIYPAPLPRPALKYHLLPRPDPPASGNAAMLYLRAAEDLSAVCRDGQAKALVGKLQHEYLTLPLDKLPRAEVRKALEEVRGALAMVDVAVRCNRCDWGTPISEPIRGICYQTWMPMANSQDVRDLARVLWAKVRLEIAEQRYDDAMATLQKGFCLAQHMGQEPLLAQKLVAFVVQAMFEDAVESWSSSRGSANLYWALGEIPSIDLRQAIQNERDMLFLFFPAWRDLRTADRTPGEWDRILSPSLEGLERLSRENAPRESPKDDSSGTSAKPPDVKAFLERACPIAQRNLLERGWPKSRVDVMAKSYAVVLDTVERYELAQDDVLKWHVLPFWQAYPRAQAVEMKLFGSTVASWLADAATPTEDKKTAGHAEKQVIRLETTLLVRGSEVLLASARRERQLTALQTIEALRAYAAEHQGRLPDRLDAIEETPVPMNPVTGKPFPYRLEGETAILDVDGPPESYPRQYRIQMAK